MSSYNRHKFSLSGINTCSYFRRKIISMNNKRFLSDEDLELLLDFSPTPEKSWDILIGSSNKNLCELIIGLFTDDERINISVVGNGCDILVGCSLELPHIIIIDDDLPDIPCSTVIQCIKRKVEFEDIKVLCYVNTEKDIDWDRTEVDDYLVKNNNDREYLSKKILSF